MKQKKYTERYYIRLMVNQMGVQKTITNGQVKENIAEAATGFLPKKVFE